MHGRFLQMHGTLVYINGNPVDMHGSLVPLKNPFGCIGENSNNKG
jgi:hypothetical protein